MKRPLVTIIGKTVKKVARIRGGGSALPGLVVERIDPNFVADTLSKLPLGVAVVSGTNGKTTTTKMVVELLESQGLKVFTNRTGSNFIRGVAAALLSDIDVRGNLMADIAVLELDEAHAVRFVEKITPKYSLLLNVMRDQLDRFGEIDYTANLLRQIAERTSDTVVLNREDKRVFNIANFMNKQTVKYFGIDPKLAKYFPNDDDLHKSISKNKSLVNADVTLVDFHDYHASFNITGKTFETDLKLNGIYNIFNAAAALAFARTIINDTNSDSKLIEALSGIDPAFGRGEKLMINNKPLELILVKNPSGFRLGLESFDPKDYTTMIAINDNYADGRDMSWLWDVDFCSLQNRGVDMVAGIRAYDMALRLQYDNVNIREVEVNLKKALGKFLAHNYRSPKRIYCTYTAMLEIRRLLSKFTDVREAIK